MNEALNELLQKMKKLTKRIYGEVSSPTKKFEPIPTSSHSKPKATPSDKSFEKAAAKASERHGQLKAVKKLLKIEVVTPATIRLLGSPEYQSFMAEKILFRLVSSTAENVAGSFNKIFMTSQFSKRFISYLYWGDDKR